MWYNPARMKISRYALILFAIIALGVALRAYNISGESIWLDEGYSIRVARLGVPEIMRAAASDNHPPLHFMMLHYWIALFGESELSVRILSLIFSALCLPLLYCAGKALYDKATGAMASIFGSISLFYIHQAQDARMYAATVFFAISSMLFFIYLFDRPRRGSIIGYAASTVLLLHTHYTGIYILIVQVLCAAAYYLVYRRDRAGVTPQVFFATVGCVAVLFLPWAVIAAKNIAATWESSRFLFTLPVKWRVSFYMGFFGHVQGYTRSGIFGYLLFPLLTATLIVRTSVGASSADRDRDRKALILLLAWCAIPIICMMVLQGARIALSVTKYSAVASPAVFFLTAASLVKIRWRPVRIIAASAVIYLFLNHMPSFYTTGKREMWREAAAYICENAAPKDLLLFNRGFFISNVFEYYCKRSDLVKVPFPPYTESVPITAKEKSRKVSEQEAETLRPYAGTYDRIWLITCYGNDPDGHIKAELLKHYKEAERRTYKGMEVMLLDKP